ncbi:MAG: DKNYY domain-containing protein [Bacteroidota bacterium]
MSPDQFIIQNKQVYFNDFLLKGVSPDGFNVVFNTAYKAIIHDIKGFWWVYDFRKKPKLKFITKDFDHFVIINEDFAKDSQFVYLIAKACYAIPKSDPTSFTVLADTPYFSKDKNHLYALSSSSGLFIYDDADYESLVAVKWGSHITDKDNVYYYGPPLELSNRAKYREQFDDLPLGDTPNFERNKQFLLQKYPDIIGWWHPDYPFKPKLPSADFTGYHQEENAAYYIFEIDDSDETNVRTDYTLIRKADIASFEILSKYYAKDQQNIYFENRVVHAVDRESFQVINHKLGRDSNALIFNGYRTEVDPSSIEILSAREGAHQLELIAKDKDHVYADQWTKFGKTGMRTGYDKTLALMKKIADPASFELLSDLWAKDQSHIYYRFKPMEQIDYDSFQFLMIHNYSHWAKDQYHLYQNDKLIKDIHGASFQVLNRFWGKDQKHVFSFDTSRIRSKIDASSFQITDDQGGAEDKDFVYYFNNFGELKKKKK